MYPVAIQRLIDVCREGDFYKDYDGSLEILHAAQEEARAISDAAVDNLHVEERPIDVRRKLMTEALVGTENWGLYQVSAEYHAWVNVTVEGLLNLSDAMAEGCSADAALKQRHVTSLMRGEEIADLRGQGRGQKVEDPDLLKQARLGAEEGRP